MDWNIASNSCVELSQIESPGVVSGKISLNPIGQDGKRVIVYGSSSWICLAMQIERLARGEIGLILQVGGCSWAEFPVPNNIDRQPGSGLNAEIKAQVIEDTGEWEWRGYPGRLVSNCGLEVMPDVEIGAGAKQV